tara:strand:+ start:38190 stop:38888 length:699 start_codon:yes stop_codon:yes gene_type:complete
MLLKKIHFPPFYKIIIVLYFIIFFLNLLFYCFFKYIQADYYNLDLCITYNCLSYFFSAFDGVVEIIEFYVVNLFYLISMVSLYVATQHYIKSNISTNMATHISNANTFKSHIEEDVLRSNIVGLSAIDSYKWYNIVYPESRNGFLLVSENYKDKIKIISKIIEESNKDNKLDYKNHQSKMIPALKQIGIEVGRSPRNNFNETEQYVLKLIKKINKEFCFVDNQVSIVEAKYY